MQPFKSFVLPGEDVVHIARILKPDGSAFVASDFTTYALTVVDEEGTPLFNDPSIPVVAGDPIFSAVQPPDGYWGGRDDVGYNFRHTLQMVDLDHPFEGAHEYTSVYVFTGPVYKNVRRAFLDECVSDAAIEV